MEPQFEPHFSRWVSCEITKGERQNISGSFLITGPKLKNDIER